MLDMSMEQLISSTYLVKNWVKIRGWTGLGPRPPEPSGPTWLEPKRKARAFSNSNKYAKPEPARAWTSQTGLGSIRPNRPEPENTKPELFRDRKF